MPDLNQDQFWNNAGWGDPAKVKPMASSRERGRRDARVAQHAHDTQKESATLGYKTEGKAYDREHKRPTVTGQEKARSSYEAQEKHDYETRTK